MTVEHHSAEALISSQQTTTAQAPRAVEACKWYYYGSNSGGYIPDDPAPLTERYRKHVRSEQHMKDIKAILADHDVTEDAAAAIAAEVRANYKTVAEWGKKVERIAELERQNAELSEAAAKVDGTTAEITALQEQVEAMKKAEADRKAAEAEQAKRDEFREAFDEALGGREFANSIIGDSVFETAYATCRENVAASAKDAIEAAVKGVDNVWKNPQRDPRRMPTDEQMKTGRNSAESQRRTFADALFG